MLIKKLNNLTYLYYDNFSLKMDMNFLNGNFFGYYIVWAIILAKENAEIFFMNHQTILHTVAVISASVLPT